MNGDNVSVTLTWPATDAVVAYGTKLTSVPDGVQIFNDDADTVSRDVTCISGYQYHQETIAITADGSKIIKVKDFTAGQPAPPPTNLQVQQLNQCVASFKNLKIIIADFTVNPEYNDANPVTEFNYNGTYTLVWYPDSSYWALPNNGNIHVWTDNGTPVYFNFSITCADGVYSSTGWYIDQGGGLGNVGQLLLGETAGLVDTTEPVLAGSGTISLTLDN